MPAILSTKLDQLEETLQAALKLPLSFQRPPSQSHSGSSEQALRALAGFKAKKAEFYQAAIRRYVHDVASAVSDLHRNNEGGHGSGDIGMIDSIFQLSKDLGNHPGNYAALLGITREMKKVAGQLPPVYRQQPLSFHIPRLPPEVKDDMEADLRELDKCFSAGCYRSSVVLCARLIETALHRKYYDVTQKDILETNPGVGLGSLIAKLAEKNIQFDPGLTQQIHLINNVRIFSVHKKQQAFVPTKEQAQAIILFTIDSVKKLFTN
ncbi:hypothetical protein HYU19_04295 [Candidatus Woesearchaeota archaeon]|nr:hypothetical protein [Candidatus Woesearchaeota archaeon]